MARRRPKRRPRGSDVESSAEGLPEAGASPHGEPPKPDPEVAAKPKRRTFTAEYKLAVLEETDNAEEGQIGAILRREGLYSSHLSAWRKARREDGRAGLGRRRGRKKKPAKPDKKRVQALERENARLRKKLEHAELILEVQGKVAGLLGLNFEDEKRS